jgi:hypothetical protein
VEALPHEGKIDAPYFPLGFPFAAAAIIAAIISESSLVQTTGGRPEA